eukprot:CAMPEP_0167775186 /NCGR_PEP_ID=MMETSP0111_2-20121227/2414_1 /TAXON_ID=91324 /ORGANISM="Lotharella globosa, Strain CCCM811" /LENGTH=118 /DNA_ID=CAMNT_0007665063 /DNA_START=126 /DNA_END=482 /DNA_ORIENTATION=-
MMSSSLSKLVTSTFVSTGSRHLRQFTQRTSTQRIPKTLDTSTVPVLKAPSPAAAGAPRYKSSTTFLSTSRLSSLRLSPLSLAVAAGSGSFVPYSLWTLSNMRSHQDELEDYMEHIIHL